MSIHYQILPTHSFIKREDAVCLVPSTAATGTMIPKKMVPKKLYESLPSEAVHFAYHGMGGFEVQKVAKTVDLVLHFIPENMHITVKAIVDDDEKRPNGFLHPLDVMKGFQEMGLEMSMSFDQSGSMVFMDKSRKVDLCTKKESPMHMYICTQVVPY